MIFATPMIFRTKDKMTTMTVAEELIVNLYKIRGNAVRMGRNDIVTVIDSIWQE